MFLLRRSLDGANFIPRMVVTQDSIRQCCSHKESNAIAIVGKADQLVQHMLRLLPLIPLEALCFSTPKIDNKLGLRGVV